VRGRRAQYSGQISAKGVFPLQHILNVGLSKNMAPKKTQRIIIMFTFKVQFKRVYHHFQNFSTPHIAGWSSINGILMPMNQRFPLCDGLPGYHHHILTLAHRDVYG
jgi:hypothetical protein